MRHKLLASTLTILIVITLLALSINSAYTSREYIINSNYMVPLIVNGVEVQPPAKASHGDIACIKEYILYIQQSKRIVFREWSDGSKDQCRTVEGNLTAIYDMEVLLQVYTEPKPLRKSEWVKAGTLVKLYYPEIFYEDGSVRYVFESWSSGETPFQANNTIYISEPTRLEARYIKEYLITAIGEVKINGTGWYREGETAVLATPSVIYNSQQDERLIFTGWESIGPTPVVISNPSSPITVISVKGPYILKANYEKQYRVEVVGPRGVIFRGWVKDGETIKIQADQTINLQEGVRLRFTGWSLPDLPSVPEIILEVRRPYNITANYVKQYYLGVESQYGASGAGWYDEGSIATVRANPQPPSNILITRKLIGYSGDCEIDCQTSNGAITLKMDSPKTVRTIYVTEPNFLTIGIITGIGGALVAVYALTGRKKPEIEAEERLEERLKKPVKEPSIAGDPSKALFKCAECGATIRGEEKAIKHARKHRYENPVLEYAALEEIAEPIDDRTAVLWSRGLKLRMTPPDQPTVKDLIQPGDIIRYTEIPLRLKVLSVEKHQRFGLPVFTIIGVPEDSNVKNGYRRYINDLVAQDGKIYCIFEECRCQVYIEARAPRAKLKAPTETSIKT